MEASGNRVYGRVDHLDKAVSFEVDVRRSIMCRSARVPNAHHFLSRARAREPVRGTHPLGVTITMGVVGRSRT